MAQNNHNKNRHESKSKTRFRLIFVVSVVSRPQILFRIQRDINNHFFSLLLRNDKWSTWTRSDVNFSFLLLTNWKLETLHAHVHTLPAIGSLDTRKLPRVCVCVWLNWSTRKMQHTRNENFVLHSTARKYERKKKYVQMRFRCHARIVEVVPNNSNCPCRKKREKKMWRETGISTAANSLPAICAREYNMSVFFDDVMK